MHNTGIQLVFMSHQVNPSHLHLVEACITLDRKVEALESKKNDHVKSVQNISCYVCDFTDHSTQDCSTLPALRESLHKQVNVVDNFKKPNSNPYSQTYNSGWKNHPNFS